MQGDRVDARSWRKFDWGIFAQTIREIPNHFASDRASASSGRRRAPLQRRLPRGVLAQRLATEDAAVERARGGAREDGVDEPQRVVERHVVARTWSGLGSGFGFGFGLGAGSGAESGW